MCTGGAFEFTPGIAGIGLIKPLVSTNNRGGDLGGPGTGEATVSAEPTVLTGPPTPGTVPSGVKGGGDPRNDDNLTTAGLTTPRADKGLTEIRGDRWGIAPIAAMDPMGNRGLMMIPSAPEQLCRQH